jgi:hypothetical protein
MVVKVKIASLEEQEETEVPMPRHVGMVQVVLEDF